MIIAADPAGIQRAVETLRQGKVVAFPTETLYGLGVDALSSGALQALRQIKAGRGQLQPFPVLISDLEMLQKYLVPEIPARARGLMAKYWPGPLTLVLPGLPSLPPPLINDRGGVGVRVPGDPVARELVRQIGRPITATSANFSGQPPAMEALQAAIAGVDLVLNDGRRAEVASTVVEVSQKVVVLRQGVIKIEEG